MIWLSVFMDACVLALAIVTVRTEMHRCPVCKRVGIIDVTRHAEIQHPGHWTPRDPDYPEYGLDPRDGEPIINIFDEKARRHVEKLIS